MKLPWVRRLDYARVLAERDEWETRYREAKAEAAGQIGNPELLRALYDNAEKMKLMERLAVSRAREVETLTAKLAKERTMRLKALKRRRKS